MSILGVAKNFIKDILGISEPGTETPVAKKGTGAPVIECKTDAPEDKYVKGNTSNSPQTKNTEGMSRKEIENNLKVYVTKKQLNFHIEKMFKKGLLEKVAGITNEEFNNLPPDKQKFVISAIEYSLLKFNELKQQGKINPNASEEELISEFGNVVFEAISSGDFKNTEDFENAIGDITGELGEDFDKKPHKEQRQKLKEHRLIAEQKLQEEIELAQKLPKEEQEIAINRINRRYRHILKGKFITIAAQMNTETGVNALIILDSKDMEYGATTILKTRSSDAERTKAADFADYEFTQGLIQDYNEVGNPVEADILKNYTKSFMEWKSTDAAFNYQKSYEADRDKYEAALEKQNRGENLSDEEKRILATMKPEYYTATAQGIGQGVLNNVNMSNDQKAEFLNNWETYASKYERDYQEVVSQVKKEIEEKPEYESIKTKITKIQQENSNAKSASPENKQTENIQETDNTSREQIYISSPQLRRNTGITTPIEIKPEASIDESQVTTVLEQARIKFSNPIDIVKEECGLDVKTEQEAVKKILEDSKLNDLYFASIVHLLKGYSLNTLEYITSNCDDTPFYAVLCNTQGSYRKDLLEYRTNTKGLCFAVKQQCEKVVGNNEINQ